MNRITKNTLLTVAVLSFATLAGRAIAAPLPQVDYGNECAKLQSEWEGAVQDDVWTSSPNFAQARLDAENGAEFCKSDFASIHQKGVAEFEQAFQLIGLNPTF